MPSNASKRRRWPMIGLGLLVLLVFGGFLLPTLNWDGAVFREVQLHVVDKSMRPIAGIEVEFESRLVGTTDQNGNLKWGTYFAAGGSRGLFNRGHWLIDGELKLKDAAGQTSSYLLSTLVPNPRPTLWNGGPIAIQVKHQQYFTDAW